MADYYTQYSKVVPGTNEQIEWLLKKFEEHKEDNEFSELGSYETDIKGLWIYDEGTDGSPGLVHATSLASVHSPVVL